MQALLDKLIANYQQDVLELEEHLRLTEELEKLLKAEKGKAAAQKKNELLPDSDGELKENPESKVKEEIRSDLIEKQLTALAKTRDQQLSVLRQRGEESAELREKIVDLLGIEDFSYKNLAGFFTENQLEELHATEKKLRETMHKMLEMDRQVIELLKTEIEAVKLELYRIKSGVQLKKVYQNQFCQEARFIDKEK